MFIRSVRVAIFTASLAWFAGAFATTALAARPAGPAASPAQPLDSTTILSADSYLRWHESWIKSVISVASAKAAGKEIAAPIVLPVTIPYRDRPDTGGLESPLPPADWAKPGFADGSWARIRGPIDDILHWQVQTGLICLRGKFTVTDPAAVKSLKLALRYRGGAVVHLNGAEVGRSDMPAGALQPTTPANPYPDDTWVDDAGKSLPNEYRMSTRAELAGRAAKRIRQASFDLPVAKLVKGVNVLAVELHRSDFHPVAVTWFGKSGDEGVWEPIGLLDLRLAATGGGVTPNVQRPGGVQVWNADIHERLTDADYGDPNEPLEPIVLAGARNGDYCGMAVLSGSAAIKGLKAAAGDLVGPAGAKVPAAAVKVGYLLPGDISRPESRPEIAFDAISDRPPAEVAPGKPPLDRRGNPIAGSLGAVAPIWIKVHVSADIGPGDYAGKLTVSADGVAPTAVPVQLHVSPWRLPDPKDFRTYVGLYQSPTSLAMHYKVPEWGDKHWELMDKSFALLAEMGTKLVNVTVVEKTQFGNTEGMVYWVRKPDGTYDYDFSVFDRYIALVNKHLRPDFVAIHLWHSGGWETRKADQENTVTVVDKATGKHEHVQVPVFATAESEKFWAPVLLAIKERLAKAGLEKQMCLGILSDGTAPPEVFAEFAKILPGVGWARGCHSPTRATAPVPLKGGSTVVLWEWPGRDIQDPAKKWPKVWNFTGPGAAFFRSDFDDLTALGFRTLAERGLYCTTRGVGRFCLDFWPVVASDRGRRTNLYNFYPFSSCAQREPTMFRLAAPGPDGPLPTVRFELVREGVQEAEAAMAVAEAGIDRADKLTPELVARCRELYAERINVARQVNGIDGAVLLDFTGWQDRSRRLYDLAAEVAAKFAPAAK